MENLDKIVDAGIGFFSIAVLVFIFVRFFSLIEKITKDRLDFFHTLMASHREERQIFVNLFLQFLNRRRDGDGR
jgi:hypothetical protein